MIRDVTGHVVDPSNEPMPNIGINRVGCELADVFSALVTKLFAAHFSAREADEREFSREQAVFGQVVERRDQLPLCEVTRRAKDHHGARIARIPCSAGCYHATVGFHVSPSTMCPSRR